MEDLASVVARAAELGELVELRLDCLHKDEWDIWRKIAGQTNRPLIVTLRPDHEGGKGDLAREDRIRFWTSIGEVNGEVMFDLELEVLNEAQAKNANLNSSRIICSQHQLEGEVAHLERKYERLSDTSAAILKIAVHAHDANDCLPVFKLIDRARSEGREIIAIAMGPAGIMTRILGPSRGSYLTFGALDDDSATAPGQLTARELREVYRVDRIDRETRIMGLIGCPVSHSRSPQIHNAAFAESNQNAVFIPFEVRDLDAFMRRMVREESREIDWNVRGFSVTAPHKTGVIKYLDSLDPAAKAIGAVNTVVVGDGGLRGYNTDAAAFLKPLSARIESLEQLRFAIIGAGGAARAVTWKLKDAGASVSLFARNLPKAKLIGDDFCVASHDLSSANFAEFDVVVNATPLGTRGALEDETPVTADQLRGVRLAYDLVYNPLETRFMSEAKAAGCERVGGLEMLIAQAAEQFKLWTGATPNLATMRNAAAKALERAS